MDHLMSDTTTTSVEPLTVGTASPDAVELLSAIEEKYGKIPNIFGTMAHQPDVLTGVATVNDGVQKDLPANLRELAYFKASQVNSCEYCSHYHSQAAKKAGVSDEQLAAIDKYENSDLFSATEQAVLSYAEQLTKTANVDDRTIKTLRVHISEKELVTLAATVALANFTNRFNHGLKIELP